jgi:hypothetical protein
MTRPFHSRPSLFLSYVITSAHKYVRTAVSLHVSEAAAPNNPTQAVREHCPTKRTGEQHEDLNGME